MFSLALTFKGVSARVMLEINPHVVNLTVYSLIGIASISNKPPYHIETEYSQGMFRITHPQRSGVRQVNVKWQPDTTCHVTVSVKEGEDRGGGVLVL